MNVTSLEDKSVLPFDSIFFNDQIDRLIDAVLPKFDRFIKKIILFYLIFGLIGFTQIVLITYFLKEIVQSALVALSLSFLFLTVFSFFILRLYLKAKRPEVIQKFKDQFQSSCEELIGFREDIAEHHLALANAFTRLSKELQGKEKTYYRPPKWLDFLAPTMEHISFHFHWLDVHFFRECLLLGSVEEHVKLVKCEPTDLEVHAALANAYVLLSSLYIPSQLGIGEEERLPQGFCEQMRKKFLKTAEMAIEEFKILSDYAPNDPWVHLQLGLSYHDLGMPEEEIREYEIVASLCPEDKDVIYKLGILYFQQGQNAKGLKIYNELKNCHTKRAEQLITYYGIYTNV